MDLNQTVISDVTVTCFSSELIFFCLEKCSSNLITHGQNILQELMMCHEMCIFVDVQEEILGTLLTLNICDDLKFTDCKMNS